MVTDKDHDRGARAPKPSLVRRVFVGDPSKAALSKAGQSMFSAVMMVLFAVGFIGPAAVRSGGWWWAAFVGYLSVALGYVWRARRIRRTRNTADRV